MEKEVHFRTLSDGTVRMDYTNEARDVAESNKTRKCPRCLPPSSVRENAIQKVIKEKGDVNDELLVLGQHALQFGAYQGQTFRWMLENGLGYAAWLVDSMRGEKPSTSALSRNKFLFKKYVESFPESRTAVEKKVAERRSKQTEPTTSNEPSTSTSPLSSLLVGRNLSPRALRSKVRGLLSPKKSSPVTRPIIPECSKELEDDELVKYIEELESSQLQSPLASPSSQLQVVGSERRASSPRASTETSFPPPSATVTSPTVAEKELLLPDGWRKSLPEADQQWISKALFKPSTSSGKAELDRSRINQLWWYPPQPSLVCTQPPHLPRKMWSIPLHCPRSECKKRELTSAGMYPHVRQVLDIDGFYSLATEYLECFLCKRKIISWSNVIIQQLDVGHRMQFPVILTYRYACDIRVVRMLRQRGLGNSSTQLQKKLIEQHSEAWLQKTAHYLTDCKAFEVASGSKLVIRPSFKEPPALVPLPTPRWLLTAYCHDVLLRLDEVKSSITSTFGEVLKMDSTKKVVKKLAGHSAGTASWATNVGNEHGQVLVSVLTSSEGYGLGPMVTGIVRRYEKAGVPPPKLLYVDRGCCGSESQLRTMFSAWPDLIIRLDVWHFMRRFSVGCTTDAHQLYGIFMGRLSQCIFEWSKDDLEALQNAKKSELAMQHITNPSEDDVLKRITKKELSTHCRRKTRGVEKTTSLISDLLEAFGGEQGLDTLGVPLLDEERIHEIWETQKRHVPCIQDPEDVQLYTQTGTVVKGGVSLPSYRCSRGSTSLESFHLHMNRFIPGTSASDVNFQAYLLEGLVRWNEDRASVAVTGGVPEPQTYSCLLRHAINELSDSVLGKSFVPSYTAPRKYTGELIGVEYLFSQTGEVLA